MRKKIERRLNRYYRSVKPKKERKKEDEVRRKLETYKENAIREKVQEEFEREKEKEEERERKKRHHKKKSKKGKEKKHRKGKKIMILFLSIGLFLAWFLCVVLASYDSLSGIFHSFLGLERVLSDESQRRQLKQETNPQLEECEPADTRCKILNLKGAKVCTADRFLDDETYEKTMEWGTYNPHIFFGVKNRSPKPYNFGLMWRHPTTVGVRHMTHEYSGIQYSWKEHDGSHYGKQKIEDQQLNLKLTTEFVKSEPDDLGVPPFILMRISGKKLHIGEAPEISLMPYITSQNPGHYVTPILRKRKKRMKCCPVSVKDSGDDYKMFFTTNDKENLKPNYYGGEENPDNLWNMDEIMKKDLMKKKHKLLRNYHRRYSNKYFDDQQNPEFVPELPLPDVSSSKNNFFVLEYLFKPQYEESFVLDIALIPKGSLFKMSTEDLSDYIVSDLLGPKLTEMLEKKSKSFNQKFKEVFHLRKNKKELIQNLSEGDLEEVGKYALSNLLGGLSYFHGDMILESWEDDQRREGVEQFSCVPSRERNPRPFLWDEGFHLELLMKWNREIAKDVLLHWFGTIDLETGWIPREQIIGNEGRSRVPIEFMLQSSVIANPPTLFVAVDDLFYSSSSGGEKIRTRRCVDENDQLREEEMISDRDVETLKQLYPLMKKNYDWYWATQMEQFWFFQGEDEKAAIAFRWEGRDGKFTFASGFDDYPRGAYDIDSGRHDHLESDVRLFWSQRDTWICSVGCI